MVVESMTKLLSAPDRGHARVVLMLGGGIAIFAGMMWVFSATSIPPVTQPHEYCPGADISCPGSKWSGNPLSYVLFVLGTLAMMGWVMGFVVAIQD